MRLANYIFKCLSKNTWKNNPRDISTSFIKFNALQKLPKQVLSKGRFINEEQETYLNLDLGKKVRSLLQNECKK